jgi:3-oxoadipate enol-lactonase
MTSKLFTIYADSPTTKPTLVLGNSLGAGAGMWASQLPGWREKFRVVCFDYPGHNPTSCVQSIPSTLDAWVGELLANLDRIGAESFSYVGVSLGGMLGLRLASIASERVERLVFANARYRQSEESRNQWDTRIQRVAEGGEAAMAQIASETIVRWLSEDFRSRQPEWTASLEKTLAATRPDGYVAGATIVRDYDAHGFIASVNCPTLLIAGSDDVAAPAAHMRELADLMNIDLVVLTGAAHLSNVDSSTSFGCAVDEFLSPPRHV